MNSTSLNNPAASFIPDVSAAINKSWNTDYVAESDGFLFIASASGGSANGGWSTIVVDGFTYYINYLFSPNNSAINGGGGGGVYVGRGQTYRFNNPRSSATVVFIPLK